MYEEKCGKSKLVSNFVQESTKLVEIEEIDEEGKCVITKRKQFRQIHHLFGIVIHFAINIFLFLHVYF